MPRILGAVLRALAIFALGLTFLVGVVLLSINVPPVSRFIAQRVNAALEPTFAGRLSIERVGYVDFGGLRGTSLTVHDPAGNAVLRARGIDVRLPWPSIAWQAVVAQADPLSIGIDDVRVRELHVQLIDDGTGTPTLVRAFEPRGGESKPPAAPGRPTELVVERIRAGIIRIRGELESTGPVHADLAQLRSQLRNDPRGTQLVVEQLLLQARAVPRVSTVTGRLRLDASFPATPTKQAAAGPELAEPGDTGTAPPTTTVYAETTAPSPLRVIGSFEGTLAGSDPASVEVRLLGEHLDASLSAGPLSPSTLARLVPALAPSAPLTLSADVEGALDKLGFAARISQADASVMVKGRVRRDAERTRLQASLDTANLDLSELLPDAPRTRLELRADGNVGIGRHSTEGNWRLSTSGSRVAGELLPPLRLEGKLSLPRTQPTRVVGTLDIDEPGAPTRVHYDVTSGAGGLLVDVSSSTRLDRPERLARYGGGLAARGNIAARARYDSSRSELQASARLALHELAHPQFGVGQLEAQLAASGNAQQPDLVLQATARDVSAAGRALSLLRLSARGTPQRLEVSARGSGQDPQRIELRASVAPGGPEQVRDARLVLATPRGTLRVDAGAVAIADGGDLRVSDLELAGAGRARASFAYAGGELEQLDVTTDRLDAARLLAIAGVETGVSRAELDLRGQLAMRGGVAHGSLSGSIDPVRLGELEAGMALDLGVERGRLSGQATLDVRPGGKTQIVARDLTLPGLPGGPRDIDDLSGLLSLAGQIDLSHLAPLLPRFGIEHTEGLVRYDVAMERPADASAPPTWRAKLTTQSLALVGERPDAPQEQTSAQARRSSPWALRDVDVNLDASLDAGRAEVALALLDQRGPLVRAAATWSDLSGIQDLLEAPESLMQRALSAHLEVPPRALDELPAPLRSSEAEGVLTLRVDASGTLGAPTLDARARIERFRPAAQRRRRYAVDLELAARYATRGGFARLIAHDRQRPLLDFDTRWSGDARDLATAPSPEGRPAPITANARLALDRFPMQLVPELRHRHIRGFVSGTGWLRNLGRDAELVLDVETDDVRVERIEIDKLEAMVIAADGQLEIETVLRGSGGRAEASVTTGLDWGARLVPRIEENLQGRLTSENLRLASLAPLFGGTVSELDGKLDADIRATLNGGTPVLNGRATLEDGVVQLPAFGQRFHDIAAELLVSGDKVQLLDLRGRGLSGGFRASAEALLAGLTPVAARAELRIDEGQKLPITLEGEAVGDAWGHLEVRYEHDEEQRLNQVLVNVGRFDIDLPRSPPGGIQELRQAEHIQVGYYRRDGNFVPIPLQPIEKPAPQAGSEERTVVVVDLGSVWVHKGQQADVLLGGNLRATLGQELDVHGEIVARRGSLDISGKQFDIERGTVTFTGGPPRAAIINAVARYDSPAGYTVYAEYTGTASQGKLRLRSEPPLSQDEILTLLLFGNPDGSFGAGRGGSSLTTAVSVAGGTAAQGLNRALSSVTELDVSARIDTSTGAPRPELVVQLTPRVTARVTQALGEPTPGQSPDRTYFTVELRLGSSWALSAMVGDQGASALDLIWRRRY